MLRNFRDLGGVPAADGCRVRAGQLFRAAAPGYLSPDELDTIAEHGIRFIADFRSDGERGNDPSRWAAERGLRYAPLNVGHAVGDPLPALMRATVDADTTHALLHDVYREIPVAQEPAFRELFARLVAGDLPVLFHCAWGKDRTGVFAALLLTVLGVHRDAIAADFVRSNEVVEMSTAAFRSEERLRPVWSAPFEAWSPLMEAQAEWLDTMFDSLAETHGSVDAYLEQRLGVGAAEREALRAHLLEPG